MRILGASKYLRRFNLKTTQPQILSLERISKFMDEGAILIRKALASDLESVVPLIKALDAHHVEIMPENFKIIEGPTRPKELFIPVARLLFLAL